LAALAVLTILQSDVGRLSERMEPLVCGLTDLLEAQRTQPHG
jgi:hypothetical protein